MMDSSNMLEKECAIETVYERFLSTSSVCLSSDTVDYIGINVSDDGYHEVIIKAYYSDYLGTDTNEHFYRFLDSREMLLYGSGVDDSSKSRRKRYDYAIKNRTNANMQALYDELNSYTGSLLQEDHVLRKLALLQIAPDKNYSLASLYHLGLVYYGQSIEMAKFYFQTRWRENGEDTADGEYRDQFYFDLMQDLDIEEYNDLIVYTKKLIEGTRTHLWMIGYDTSLKEKKYKIYLKRFRSLVEIIESSAFSEMNRLREALFEVNHWYEGRCDIVFVGMALCYNERKKFSINLYFSYVE